MSEPKRVPLIRPGRQSKPVSDQIESPPEPTGKVIKSPLWSLRITSYVGVSAGAIHSYGRLVQDAHDERGCSLRQEYRIEHQITAKEAANLNRAGILGPPIFEYKSGDLAEGFENEDEVVEAAKVAFANLADLSTDALYQGFDSENIIAGNPKVEDNSPRTTRAGHGCPPSPLPRTVKVKRGGKRGDEWVFVGLEDR